MKKDGNIEIMRDASAIKKAFGCCCLGFAVNSPRSFMSANMNFKVRSRRNYRSLIT